MLADLGRLAASRKCFETFFVSCLLESQGDIPVPLGSQGVQQGMGSKRVECAMEEADS